MILHWLTGYSIVELMTVGGFLIGILSNIIQLFPHRDEKNRLPVPVVLIGIASFGGWAASILLHGKPHWADLSVDLGIAGAVGTILYVTMTVILSRGRKRIAAVAPATPAPSNNVWPPPPTSHPIGS